LEAKERSGTTLLRDDTGRQFLRAASPIENEPECHRCHRPEESINGVIVTDLSTADLDRHVVVDLQEALLISVAAIAVTGFAATLVLRRTVLARLKLLVETTRHLGRGDLDRRLKPRGHDEIDELMGSLNAMAQSLKQRTGDLTRAREEIARKAAQLQRLLVRTVRIQEEERERIAHDMHDGVIQFISGALFESQAARERLPGDPQIAEEKLAVVQQLLTQVEEEVRRSIGDLHPPLLDLAALAPAIKKHARLWEERWGIPCSVQVQGMPISLPPHMQVAIYRIVQEALVNIRVHSAAHWAHILLECREEELRVMVRDDGRGFDWQQALTSPSERLGLIGMRERAQSLGGDLEIRSAPGQGTAILVKVPLGAASGDPRREDRL
jgi:two-component system sensor histidine kinase DegS